MNERIKKIAGWIFGLAASIAIALRIGNRAGRTGEDKRKSDEVRRELGGIGKTIVDSQKSAESIERGIERADSSAAGVENKIADARKGIGEALSIIEEVEKRNPDRRDSSGKCSGTLHDADIRKIT